jgi:hypothetical protein
MEPQDVEQILRLKLVKASRDFVWKDSDPYTKGEWINFAQSAIRFGLMEIKETIYNTGRGRLSEGLQQESTEISLIETLASRYSDWHSVEWEDLKHRARNNPVVTTNLLRFEGKSYEEISEILGYKIHTVKHWTHGEPLRESIQTLARWTL